MSSRRLVCFSLALLALATFAQVRHFDFTDYDDAEYVSENPRVQGGLSADGLRWAFVDSRTLFWIPVTWLSHELDCQLFGLNPGAPHVVNLLLHTANVVLLFLLLQRITGASWRSAFVAACFAVHPLNVEAVAWIAERKGVLSTFFLMLTLHAWAGWVQTSRRSFYGLALLCYGLGLLAKPMLVTLPLLLIVLDGWPFKRWQPAAWKKLVAEKLPFFALAAAMGLATMYFASRAELWISTQQISLWQRAVNAFFFVGVYLWKLIAPVNLAVFYPFATGGTAVPGIGAGMATGLVTLLAWRNRKSAPWLLAGWGWYVVALLPVLRLFQVGAHAIADRYAYIPCIGLFIVIAWGCDAVAKRWEVPSRAIAVVGGAVVAGMAALAWFQAGVWHNSITLFSHSLEVAPENAVAHINLGVALEQAGRPSEAQAHYIKAIEIDPGRAQAHHNLANILDTQGRFEEARPHFEEAMRLRPREARPHCSYGQALVGQRRFAEAMAQYATAMELAPRDPLPHYLAGIAQLRQGHYAQATVSWRAALRLNSNHWKTLDRLARLLAAAPDAPVRDGGEALKLATRAADLTDRQIPTVLDTLAMAYAESGRFDEAVREVEEAMELFKRAGAAEEAAKLEPQLRQFKARQPWREPFTD